MLLKLLKTARSLAGKGKRAKSFHFCNFEFLLIMFEKKIAFFKITVSFSFSSKKLLFLSFQLWKIPVEKAFLKGISIVFHSLLKTCWHLEISCRIRKNFQINIFSKGLFKGKYPALKTRTSLVEISFWSRRLKKNIIKFVGAKFLRRNAKPTPYSFASVAA